MKLWLIGALVTVVAVTSPPTPAEAKRFGGGGFSGMQRKAPAPAPKPAAPAQGQQAAVNLGVQGLDPAVHHFRKACDVGHIGHI